MANPVFAVYRNQMSGTRENRDGCATVTGYKLHATDRPLDREGGSEVQARSQDTDLSAPRQVVKRVERLGGES